MNESYTKSGQLAMSANYYTRKLCGASSLDPLDKSSVDRAMEVLDRFRSVIILGRDNLHRELARLGLTATVNPANRTEELATSGIPESSLTVTDDDRLWFESRNRLDMRLFRQLSRKRQLDVQQPGGTPRLAPQGQQGAGSAGDTVIRPAPAPGSAAQEPAAEEPANDEDADAGRLALLQAMRGAFQTGDHDRVLDIFETLSAVPGLRSGIRVEAITLAARTKRLMGQNEAARRLIDDLLERDLKNHRLYRYVAIACVELGEYRQASIMAGRAAALLDLARSRPSQRPGAVKVDR